MTTAYTSPVVAGDAASVLASVAGVRGMTQAVYCVAVEDHDGVPWISFYEDAGLTILAGTTFGVLDSGEVSLFVGGGTYLSGTITVSLANWGDDVGASITVTWSEVTQTVFGQTVALADEIVAGLDNIDFCLPVAATRRFVRVTDLKAIPRIGQPVALDVFAGKIESVRDGLDGIYHDTYDIHVLMQQSVVDETAGGLSESQVSLLLQLHSEIIEFLCSRIVAAASAVHPFSGARVVAVAQGQKGAYDLVKLEEDAGLFWSEIVFTYRAVGLRRKFP